ncbi:MAG: FAD-binding domain-containing protein [Paracoccaceae bacterium]
MTPTRHAALARLDAFADRAGPAYAEDRNFDRPGHPHVSGLSPWIRHRLLSEPEVLRAVLDRHDAEAASKFIQEVCWRTYWKGWLEMRPAVWGSYRDGVRRGLDALATQSGLRREWEAACSGETGIAAFDHWAKQLVAENYLHNHARMWFASIWIHTLRLPWALGADFFLRHLVDGDPASNTLGWRWVAGVQTPGKPYLAQPGNVARYTDGRLRAEGLAGAPHPVDALANPKPGALPDQPSLSEIAPADRVGMILHEDDLTPEWLIGRLERAGARVAGTYRLDATADRSPLEVAPAVAAFARGGLDDALSRLGARAGEVAGADVALADWARGFDVVVAPYAPQGPARAAIRKGAPEARLIRRPWDDAAWPFATAGFFKFRKRIPELLETL